jgi:hypothetical protein
MTNENPFNEDPKFVSEMAIEYAIKQSRKEVSLMELARAIHQSLPQEEFVALMSAFQKYECNN